MLSQGGRSWGIARQEMPPRSTYRRPVITSRRSLLIQYLQRDSLAHLLHAWQSRCLPSICELRHERSKILVGSPGFAEGLVEVSGDYRSAMDPILSLRSLSDPNPTLERPYFPGHRLLDLGFDIPVAQVADSIGIIFRYQERFGVFIGVADRPVGIRDPPQ